MQLDRSLRMLISKLRRILVVGSWCAPRSSVDCTQAGLQWLESNSGSAFPAKLSRTQRAEVLSPVFWQPTRVRLAAAEVNLGQKIGGAFCPHRIVDLADFVSVQSPDSDQLLDIPLNCHSEFAFRRWTLKNLCSSFFLVRMPGEQCPNICA